MSDDYKNNQEKFAQRGIDYDLEACLAYNPQSFGVMDIERVLAVWEGENEGDDWRWIIELTDGRFVYLTGWCDYTGWDCQSGALHAYAATPEAAADCEMENLLDVSTGGRREVRENLLQQIRDGKTKTWHERKSEEFGTPPFVDPTNINQDDNG